MEGLTEQQKKVEDNFMNNWRLSEFYPFVMKIINDELDSSYIKDIVIERTLNSQPMNDEEIGREVRVEVQVNLRLKKVKETIE